MIFAVIVAGGTGSRMGKDMPKQFLEIGSRPIIIHTLVKFLQCEVFDKVYIGIHPDWQNYMQELVDKYIDKNKDKVVLTPGGKDRNSTLFNVIDDICRNYGEDEDHIIITHDGVRPFFTVKLIEENISAVQKYGAVATVIPSTDTIMCSYDGTSIDNIPDRKNMFCAQTPQSFNLMKLKRVFASLTEEEKQRLTDACGVFAYKGEYVHFVQGDPSNIKITTPIDMVIAEAILRECSF
ncbi:MAG: 2-C-methyl-D-erythritol 4-phosphate cytidylyltransferase [Anaerofustis stercorihominis]|nr:2-C-methyl-D-erythritol 4-phosphate cytidylyltransferase [Anaerofustis stercorihominis]